MNYNLWNNEDSFHDFDSNWGNGLKGRHFEVNRQLFICTFTAQQHSKIIGSLRER